MLLMPLMRFVGSSDARWLATLEAIERALMRDGMVYRYRNDDAHDDGLVGEEGAFTACSFWYVECLARAGQVEKAHLEFEQLLRFASPWACMPRNSTCRAITWATRPRHSATWR